MPKFKALPEMLYVAWEDESAPYLSAEEEIRDLASKEGVVLVGVYKLLDVKSVELEVVSTLKVTALTGKKRARAG